MMNELPTLLIPEKIDIETQQVAEAWNNRGGSVKRLGKYWIKENALQGKQIAVYGNQTFSLVLAQIYNLELISPDDTLIARLDRKWIKRQIVQRRINDIAASDFPAFVKPVIPKTFVSGVFSTIDEFTQQINSLEAEEQVLISEVIHHIQAEVRGYVLNGSIKDLAIYEGYGDLQEGLRFLESFIQSNADQIPYAVIIDMAYSSVTGWFILEFNACWGAGLNNCKAEKVIDCIKAATIKK